METPQLLARNSLDTLQEMISKQIKAHHVTNPENLDEAMPQDAHLIVVNEGQKLVDVTDHLKKAAQTLKPWRRSGTAKLATLQSLVDWANRNKGDTSVLFANPSQDAPTLTCIANYHGIGPASLDGQTPDSTAQHGDHRGVYAFPLSKEWKRWSQISGKPLDKDEMGAFIEDNAKDFIDPTPALLSGMTEPQAAWEERLIEQAKKIDGRFGHHLKLIEMSRVFQAHEVSNLSVSSNRDSGESTIAFVNEHRDQDGKPLQIPNLFLIAIPVFESGALYRLPVRFQYRKSGSGVKFILTIYDPARAFDDAFKEAIDTATAQTTLPVFMGQPET